MICNSGGARGSDQVFSEQCESKGIEVIAWSFEGHDTKSKNRKILTKEELDEGWNHVLIANKNLKRNIYRLSPYVKKLLSRNWFQVKNSHTVYAIGQLDGKQLVLGGTGWAVQMAVDGKELHDGKNIYVFDQIKNSWYTQIFSMYTDDWEWCKIEGTPKLTDRDFAGIGTRDINENGIKAIKELLKRKD